MKRLFYIFLSLLPAMMMTGQTTEKTCADWYKGFSEAMDTVHSFGQTGRIDTMQQIRSYLDQWEQTDTDCADRYTCEFNYHFGRAVISSITTTVRRPPYVGQAMTLTDSTGNIAGYMYQGYMVVDSSRFEMAVDWLGRALVRYPERIDIWQGEIMAFLYADEIDRMIELFDRFLAFSTHHNGTWLYTNDTPLQQVVKLEDDPVVLTVQDRMSTLLDNDYYQDAMRLVDTALKHYPSSPVFLNDKAVIYYQIDDYEQALFWMQKAAKANPKDKLIKHNINYIKKELKQRKKK